MKLIYPNPANNLYLFWCPGCKCAHMLDDRWTISGSPERPTVAPSVKVSDPHSGASRCHLFIKDGSIEYLSDCEHGLAGHTAPMEPIPDSYETGFPPVSDDPREATAGEGLSAERRDKIRRAANSLRPSWAPYIDADPDDDPLTCAEMISLLDDSDALQAAREQLDEAGRELGALKTTARDLLLSGGASASIPCGVWDAAKHFAAVNNLCRMLDLDTRGAGGAPGEE